ncbi:MAG: iron ABC transporter permease [Planctomycetes bacterium]|nr:iron ABC transporter permease [Planctomycetota bacterium]
MTARRVVGWLALTLVVLAVLYLGCSYEGPGIASLFVWCTGGLDEVEGYVFTGLRLPRLLVAACGGASLALAGAVMQATFRNPLASPDLVGTAAGAALGGACAIVLQIASLGLVVVPAASLLGALVVTGLVFVLARAHGRFATATLLLAGIALNTLVGALTSFVVTLSFDNYTASSNVLFWLMGGLESRTWEHAVITAAGLVVFGLAVVPRRRELDLLTLHDDTAHSLGVDAPRVRRWLVLCACGLTAATVSNTGGIAFVGLVVPHLARLLVGPAHRVLLPAAALLGAILMVGSDLVCRLTPPTWNLRLGVVTAFFGAPYFLFLLARNRRLEDS